MRRQGKRIRSLAAGLIISGALCGFPAFAGTAYVNASNVNYRTGPSLESEAVGRLSKGTKIERQSDDGTWSRVSIGQKTYYIASRYLSESAPEQAKKADGQTPEESPYVDQTWEVSVKEEDPYASFSKIKDGVAVYYHNGSQNRKEKTVCVNAGHGTKGGEAVKTKCHPDGSAKVTGGTTGAGAVTASAVSSGMTFSDGTPESQVTLAMAKKLRDRLLAAGYDVLMIREGDDVQLDNIARTVIANTHADIHVALHWDSTNKDKGCFFMSVPNHASYRRMEPVKSHWESHNDLGASLIAGLKAKGCRIFSNGSMEMDLTQTSYSTIPSVDIELGDKASAHTDAALETLADGLLKGIEDYFSSSAI